MEDASELSTVPDAEIADKANSVHIQVQALNDQIPDGTQNSRIFVTAGGYQPAEINIEVKDPVYDFGDAPDPLNAQAGAYPTLLSSDGARHVPQGPLLGALRDAELDAAVSGDANGDDGNNTDDEEGVILPQL